MAFDVSGLNEACLDISDEAVWISKEGPKTIAVTISSSPDVEGEGMHRVVVERITGETTLEQINGVQRDDTIIKDGVNYSVLGYISDVTGWVVIELEKL